MGDDYFNGRLFCDVFTIDSIDLLNVLFDNRIPMHINNKQLYVHKIYFHKILWCLKSI